MKGVITGSGNGLSPSHCLNQWWLIINQIPGNKIQRNYKQNTVNILSWKCIWKCHLQNQPFCSGLYVPHIRSWAFGKTGSRAAAFCISRSSCEVGLVKFDLKEERKLSSLQMKLKVKSGPNDNKMTRKNSPHYWPFVKGIHLSPVDCPHEEPVTLSFEIFYIVKT